jgi:hypothetical protein
VGKKDIEIFCKKISAYIDSITTNFKQLNFIENDNCVAINGTAEFLRDGKRIGFVSSCDVNTDLRWYNQHFSRGKFKNAALESIKRGILKPLKKLFYNFIKRRL